MKWPFSNKNKEETSGDSKAKATLTKKAQQWAPASTDNFHSSYWQPVSPCESHAGIYVEAFCVDDTDVNGWVARKVTVDNDGHASPKTIAKDCCYFEALRQVGEFEGTAATALSDTLHEKQDRDMPGLYFKDHAHKSGLFIDEDCLPHLNIGGTPVGADNARISEEELRAVKALPPQKPEFNLATLPALSGITVPALRKDFQITTEIANHYDTDEQIALLDIEQRLKTILRDLGRVKKNWTNKPCDWDNRKWENYDRAISWFKTALNQFDSLQQDSKISANLQDFIGNLTLETQTVYTTWLTQTAKTGDVKEKLEGWAHKASGYNDIEYHDRAPLELRKLQEMIKAKQEAASDDAGNQTANLNMVMPLVMADYTPEEFTALFNKFYKHMEEQTANVSIYKQAKIQSYGQKESAARAAPAVPLAAVQPALQKPQEP